MTVVLAVAVFTAVSTAAFAVLDTVQSRTRMRESLQQLGQYGEQDARDERLLEPLVQRVVAPIATWATHVGHAFTPSGYAAALRRKLTMAGRRKPEAVDRFLAERVLWLIGGLVGAVLIGAILPFQGTLRFSVLGLIVFMAALAPRAALNRAAEQRQQTMRAGLANVIDLLSISVEAGFGLDQALERVAADANGPLAEELRRLQGDMRAGASRTAALRALLERTDVPELRSFVFAILQSDTFGVPIAPILRAQADEMRVRQRQLVQERAQKAPVKMLVPMVFCIFPALFVVVIGPAIINILDGFR